MTNCRKDMLTIFQGYPTEFAGIPWIFVDFSGVDSVAGYQMDIRLGNATRHYDDITAPVSVNFTKDETNLPIGVNSLSVIIYDPESRGKPFTTAVPVNVINWTGGYQRRAGYQMTITATKDGKGRFDLTIKGA